MGLRVEMTLAEVAEQQLAGDRSNGSMSRA
jgi:hypothetical protein